jgi:hypothetical protein
MIFYATSTTERLQGYARARGMEFGIAYAPDNSAGAYFVINVDRRPLPHWIALGWTRAEAEESIDQMPFERAEAEREHKAWLDEMADEHERDAERRWE